MAMEVVTTIKETKELSDAARNAGSTVGLVATLGYMHTGHMEVLRIARNSSDFLIMPLLLKPKPINENYGPKPYPKDIDGDIEKAKEAGVDVVFVINVDDLYENPNKTNISVTELSKGLSSIDKPFHFRRITTIMTKLINLLQPHKVYFGKKDFQRLAILNRMVFDMAMNVEIVEIDTVRDDDGLAMSTRNTFLTEQERVAARALPESINEAKNDIISGIKESKVILDKITKKLTSEPVINIIYAVVCDSKTLRSIDRVKKDTTVAVSIEIGTTRLTDSFTI